ncbi:MAG: nucleotidyltransferase domain-containing protein [Alphaproteobacteria bacterium]
MTERLPIDQTKLAEFCGRHHIRRLSLFGSVLKGQDRPDSDVDLLIEFTTVRTPSLIALAGIQHELTALLGGRRVDPRTPQDLSRHFRDAVMREAVVQFEAA